MSNSYYVKTNWDLYEDLSKPYQWSRSNDKDGTTKGTEAVVREQNKKDVMAARKWATAESKSSIDPKRAWKKGVTRNEPDWVKSFLKDAPAEQKAAFAPVWEKASGGPSMDMSSDDDTGVPLLWSAATTS